MSKIVPDLRVLLSIFRDNSGKVSKNQSLKSESSY